MSDFDHIVIGGGHNGLVCATLLARRGRRVLLIEGRSRIGGMTDTRQIAPGFHVSGCAHLVHGLSGPLTQELALENFGLRWAAQDLPTVALGGESGLRLTAEGIATLPAADRAAWPEFERRMRRFASVFETLFGREPFSLAFAARRDQMNALGLGWKIRTLGRRDMREFLRIIGMNAYDLLEDTFESPLLKGLLGFDAVLSGEYGPRSPGTVMTLLYRLAGQAPLSGAGAALPVGGLGALSDALAQAATAAGVEIRTGTRVERILVEDDHARGVVLEGGTAVNARSVISSADPKRTFLKLLGAEYLDTDFVRRIDHFRARGNVAKFHLALNGLPEFKGVRNPRELGRVLIAPTLGYLEAAYDASKYGQMPSDPALEISVPSVFDRDLAPAGQHVLSANVLFVPHAFGGDEAAGRAQLTERILAVLERHAPGLGKLIVSQELLLPVDLEREYHVTGGHWHHGALTLDQFFFTRPVPGAARYDSPMPGLYLCGAGSHPGGGVMGWAGRNAAQRVLQGIQ